MTNVQNQLLTIFFRFSDPTVLVERLAIKSSISAVSSSSHTPIVDMSKETIDSKVKKENEGLSSKDPHTCLRGKLSTNRKNLSVHLKLLHRPIFCDLCPEVLLNKRDLKKHLKIHFKNLKFACNVCSYETGNKQVFKRHKLIHADKVECPICKKHVSHLNGHMRNSHKPRAACSICQKIVAKSSMYAHMRVHNKSYQCSSCEEVFDKRQKLRRWDQQVGRSVLYLIEFFIFRHHLKNHYEGRLYECNCGSVYKTKGQLKRHEESHKEKWTCKVCLKQCSTREEIRHHWKKKHLKTHGFFDMSKYNGSTFETYFCLRKIIIILYFTAQVLNRSGPFICDICGTKLSSRLSFMLHNRNLHQNTNAYAFCDSCPRSFKRKHILLAHIRKDHLKLSRFECKLCDYKSFYSGGLKSHMLQHSSKIECKLCHKFVANMKSHLRSHKKVECPICKKLLLKMNLRKHMQVHTKKLS